MVTSAEVRRFWIPLSITWMIMALEGPILASVVARMEHATFNLAAYGVAVAIAMMVESPVINLLSTVVALARDRAAASALRIFMMKVNVLVTTGMVVVCIPIVFETITYSFIGMPFEIGSRMYWGLVCLIPWPAAIGVRRYYQGLLIRYGQTKLVAWGTGVRLLGMGSSAFTLVMIGGIPGVVIGTASLTCGVILESVATVMMARGVVKMLAQQKLDECEPPPTNRQIMRFYVPLAMTSTIGFVVTPMIAFFMNKAPDPVASLAVLPVVDAFVFFFRSFGFSYQEVGIAFLGRDPKSYAVVRSVGKRISIITTVVMAAIVFTPAMGFVYGNVFGLEASLVDKALLPTMLLILLPSIAVMYSVQRSVLIAAHRTMQVTWSTIVEVGGIAIVMAVCVAFGPWAGVISAGLAMSVGRLGALAYSAYWSKVAYFRRLHH